MCQEPRSELAHGLACLRQGWRAPVSPMASERTQAGDDLDRHDDRMVERGANEAWPPILARRAGSAPGPQPGAGGATKWCRPLT